MAKQPWDPKTRFTRATSVKAAQALEDEQMEEVGESQSAFTGLTRGTRHSKNDAAQKAFNHTVESMELMKPR